MKSTALSFLGGRLLIKEVLDMLEFVPVPSQGQLTVSSRPQPS
jgi:hypothetical protein